MASCISFPFLKKGKKGKNGKKESKFPPVTDQGLNVQIGGDQVKEKKNQSSLFALFSKKKKAEGSEKKAGKGWQIGGDEIKYKKSALFRLFHKKRAEDAAKKDGKEKLDENVDQKCKFLPRLPSLCRDIPVEEEVQKVGESISDHVSSLQEALVEDALSDGFEEEEAEEAFFSCPSSPLHDLPHDDKIEEKGKEEEHDASVLSNPPEQGNIVEEPAKETGGGPDRSADLLPRFVLPSMPGAGLKNMGNTCFLNSVLQCIIHTGPLVEKLWSIHHNCSERFCTFCALKELIEASYANSGSALSPAEFVHRLSFFSTDFMVGRQSDAHELLRCLIDKLDESSQIPLAPQVYGGQLRSQLRCSQCSHVSETLEPFLDLSLEINKSCKTLEEALQSFLKTEFLQDFKCGGCEQTGSGMEKRIMLAQLPDVLTVHLKRFTNDGRKIKRDIAYPLELDLAPFLLASQHSNNYELFALIEHQGSFSSGHYINIVRTSEASWHRFSDSKVSPITQKEAVSRSAYLLFYRKKGARVEMLN